MQRILIVVVITLKKMIGIREKAPEWTSTAIMPNKVKKTISLSDYNGRYVALIFLSTSFNTSSLSDLLSYSKRQIEFDALNCQVIIVSNDSYYTILSCINSIDSAGLNDMKIPIVSDYNMNIVKRYGMYGDSDDVIMEGVVLISSIGVVRHVYLNNNVSENIEEVIRLVKAFQFTDKNGEVCPANWNPGDMTIKATPTDAQDYFNHNKVSTISSDSNSTTSVRLRSTREYTPLEEEQLNSTLKRLLSIIGSSSDVILRSIKRIINSYNAQLQKKPLITKTITSGFIALISEWLRVYITKRRLNYSLTRSTRNNNLIMNPHDILSLSTASIYSWQKVVLMGSFGFLVSGPLHHYWYRFLDLIVVNRMAVPQGIRGLVKVIIHQLALTPSFLAFTLGFMEYLSTHSTTTTYSTIKRLYVRTLFTNWKIITILQAINLGAVPESHKVIFNDLINIWWFSYLTHLTIV